jgi:CoA:oxalate CoA-transferase
MLLEGITVLDLTRVVSGPACTRTLADFGAEVIKIEPPEGDLLRRGVPKVRGVAIGFAQLNAGKRHLSVDLSNARGRELVQKLAAQVDVLVENYRPGVASRLGLGYAEVRAANPDIIYCSISGYGQTGSAAGRRAYAPVIHAELGLVELNARERGTSPLPEAVSHVDFAAGAQAASAVLAALVGRLRGGGGQHIDVSMAETMLAVNEFTAVEINGGFGNEISPFRPGRAALLRLHDGTWVQVPGNPTTWIFGVARALGRTAELAARGWHAPENTQGKEPEIHALMQTWAGEFDSVADFEAALDAARIPLGTVKPLASVAQESWAVERGVFVDVDVNGQPVQIPRSPMRFSATEVGPRSGAYLQGADNRLVLRQRLGLSDAEFDALEAEGVLIEERPDLAR